MICAESKPDAVYVSIKGDKRDIAHEFIAIFARVTDYDTPKNALQWYWIALLSVLSARRIYKRMKRNKRK